MAETVRIINLEQGMPLVEEARKRLLDELKKAKTSGCKAIKIIHGYGSSGVGGKIKPAVHRSLAMRKREGGIREYVPGEDWEVFDERARRLLDEIQQLRKDSDLGKANPGITMVLL
ncbi:MAG: Smr/MutS family protein [Solirubrobacterales bacterium]